MLNVGNKGGSDFFGVFLRQTDFLTPMSDLNHESMMEPVSKVQKTEISLRSLSSPNIQISATFGGVEPTGATRTTAAAARRYWAS